MNTNLRPIYEKYKNDSNFVILSHTVNPSTDTVAECNNMLIHWELMRPIGFSLRARKDSLYLAARQSYLLDDPKNNLSPIDDQFVHTQFFALVDKHGNVRSITDGLKKDELAEMQKQIGELLKETVN